MGKSELESILALQMRMLKLPEPEREYRMPEYPDRKWAFDFAWPDKRLLVEVNGSTWVANTGHTSGTGIERDTEKHNAAVLAGYRVLVVTGTQIGDGRALEWIENCLTQTNKYML
jgi:very-short-patch-repair endonuclease